MSETTHQYGYADARVREISTAQLLGQVMFLVAVALAFCVAGTLMGRDLSEGAARACSFAGLGMLIVTWFVDAVRRGPLGIGWMCGFSLLIGLGLGPVIAYFASVEEAALTQAFAGTAATVLGAGALGFALSKDLARWMRPLALLVFGACMFTIVLTLFGGTISPIISLVIYGLSAALIMVDFNYIRKHGTENDAIWLATGIFVSIVNIFVSLLNIFSGRCDEAASRGGA